MESSQSNRALAYYFADGVSPPFVDRYATSNSSSAYDATDGVSSRVLLEVTMCTLTPCGHCSALLYDEDIMSGWSAQDSDLNTVYVDADLFKSVIGCRVDDTFVSTTGAGSAREGLYRHFISKWLADVTIN